MPRLRRKQSHKFTGPYKQSHKVFSCDRTYRKDYTLVYLFSFHSARYFSGRANQVLAFLLSLNRKHTVYRLYMCVCTDKSSCNNKRINLPKRRVDTQQGVRCRAQRCTARRFIAGSGITKYTTDCVSGQIDLITHMCIRLENLPKV